MLCRGGARGPPNGNEHAPKRGGFKVEYFLLRISYTAAGWDHIVKTVTSFDARMDPVRRLIAGLGGSFAAFQFHGHGLFKDDARQHVVLDKFAVFGGEELMGVLAMPDKHAAQAFKLNLLSQPTIRAIELVSMVPYEEVISRSVPAAKSAMAQSRYAGPGAAAP